MKDTKWGFGKVLEQLRIYRGEAADFFRLLKQKEFRSDLLPYMFAMFFVGLVLLFFVGAGIGFVGLAFELIDKFLGTHALTDFIEGPGGTGTKFLDYCSDHLGMIVIVTTVGCAVYYRHLLLKK